MAQLIVRNLEEEIVRKLKKRAAANGRSVEAEHREILRKALLGPKTNMSLKDTLLGMPSAGRADFRRNRQKPRRVRL